MCDGAVHLCGDPIARGPSLALAQPNPTATISHLGRSISPFLFVLSVVPCSAWLPERIFDAHAHFHRNDLYGGPAAYRPRFLERAWVS